MADRRTRSRDSDRRLGNSITSGKWQAASAEPICAALHLRHFGGSIRCWHVAASVALIQAFTRHWLLYLMGRKKSRIESRSIPVRTFAPEPFICYNCDYPSRNVYLLRGSRGITSAVTQPTKPTRNNQIISIIQHRKACH